MAAEATKGIVVELAAAEHEALVLRQLCRRAAGERVSLSALVREAVVAALGRPDWSEARAKIEPTGKIQSIQLIQSIQDSPARATGAESGDDDGGANDGKIDEQAEAGAGEPSAG